MPIPQLCGCRVDLLRDLPANSFVAEVGSLVCVCLCVRAHVCACVQQIRGGEIRCTVRIMISSSRNMYLVLQSKYVW